MKIFLNLNKTTLFLVLIIFIPLFSCNTKEENKGDTYKAYWVEEVSQGNPLWILDFTKQTDNTYKGNLTTFSKAQTQKTYILSDLIFENDSVKFTVSDLNYHFKGKFAEDGFKLIGEFIYPGKKSKAYKANKMASFIYDEFMNKHFNEPK